jgi:hypothetical protein
MSHNIEEKIRSWKDVVELLQYFKEIFLKKENKFSQAQKFQN